VETSKKGSGLIDKFDQVDRFVSGLLHSCVVKPQFLELVILPFAYLFQPFMFPFLIVTIGIFFPVVEE
jgi:hypothetical protein